MKKILLFPIMMLIVFMTACSGGLSDTSSTQKSQPPAKVAKDYMTQIINCFENDDKIKMKELMSDYIIEDDIQLDNEIDAALDFIDGKIVSYDEPFGDAMGSHEKKACGGRVKNIITEHGTEYSVSFTGWLTYDADESRIGVEGIRIVNDTKRAEYPYDATEEELADCMLKIGNFE